MNKNFLLTLTCVFGLSVTCIQAMPRENNFMLIVKATTDEVTGEVLKINKVLDIRPLTHDSNTLMQEIPHELTFNSGFNHFTKGVEHTIEGAIIMLVVVGQKVMPYIVNTANNIVIPVCKKSYNIFTPLSQKAYHQVIKFCHYFYRNHIQD